MAATHRVESAALHSIDRACCPLCKGELPLKGMLYTPDFGLLVRDGHVAKFTWGEAAVVRELFNEKQRGFRLERARLLDRIYSGSDAPMNAANVLSSWIQQLRAKLLPLGMGIVSDSGAVNLVFTPPGYKRK